MTLVLNFHIVINVSIVFSLILMMTAYTKLHFKVKLGKNTKDKTAKRRKPTKDKNKKLKVRNP